MNIPKIIYWITTALMCLIFLYSATMYLTKYEMVTGFFTALGFPVWMVYPLAIAKLLAIVAILSNQSKFLKEWAYAGFFFDAVMATAAHYMAGHGLVGLSLVAVILIVVSRYFDAYRTSST